MTSSDAAPELSLASNCQIRSADVIVNARLATSPELLHELNELFEATVRKACQAVNATVKFRQTQSFRPARPVVLQRLDATWGFPER